MAVALDNYLEDTRISQADLSKKIGVSPSYLTHARKREWSWQNGLNKDKTPRYTEFSMSIAKQIMVFLGLDEMVWEIDNYQEIIATLTEAKKFHEHRIIDGKKGTGKTKAANIFKKRHPVNTFIVTCSEDMNPKALMIDIAEKIGAESVGDRRKIRIAIQKKLKTMAYPQIIFDECENLRPASYGSVKALYDEVFEYCSLVLMGANNYYKKLKKLAEADKGCFPQILSRFNSEPVFLSIMTWDDALSIFPLYDISDRGTQRRIFDNSSDFRELERNIQRHLRDSQLLQEAA